MLSRLIAAIKSRRKTIAPPPAGNYVGLMGGLGNQLFQYAYARYLVANGVAISALATNLFKHDQYGRKPLVQAISRLPAIDLQREQIAALKIMADEYRQKADRMVRMAALCDAAAKELAESRDRLLAAETN